MYLSGQYSSYCMCRRLGDITDKGIFSEKMFVSWLIIVLSFTAVFACSTITLEGTSGRHEVLGVYENITDGRSCGDGHDVYMQAWPRQVFYLYYLTEDSSWIVSSDLCETSAVLQLNTEDLLAPGVTWKEYYGFSWNNVSTISATCGHSQPCSRIFVENSLTQYGSEGVYEKIEDVICTVRPVYRQIWPNFIDVQYLFFAWEYDSWLIGDTYENCNETKAGLTAGIHVKDGSSSPDKVTQPWFNSARYGWEENEELTVICDGDNICESFELSNTVGHFEKEGIYTLMPYVECKRKPVYKLRGTTDYFTYFLGRDWVIGDTVCNTTVFLALAAKTITPDRSSLPWEEVSNGQFVVNPTIDMTCTGYSDGIPDWTGTTSVETTTATDPTPTTSTTTTKSVSITTTGNTRTNPTTTSANTSQTTTSGLFSIDTVVLVAIGLGGASFLVIVITAICCCIRFHRTRDTPAPETSNMTTTPIPPLAPGKYDPGHLTPETPNIPLPPAPIPPVAPGKYEPGHVAPGDCIKCFLLR